MPIKIVRPDPDQCGIPAIFCDACGKEIEHVDDGNFHWRSDDELPGATLYFSHRSACCSIVDRREKTANAMNLDDLMLALTVNLGFDLKKTLAKERMFPSFIWGRPKPKRQRAKT
jgi:hypothetical protein